MIFTSALIRLAYGEAMVLRWPGMAGLFAALALSAVLLGCAGPVTDRSASAMPASDTPSPDGGSAPTAPSSPTPPAVPSSPAAGSPSPFVGTASPVTAADLPHSWRPGCPVEPAALRRLRLSYWGFDGQPHEGTLVVHQDVATDVIGIFSVLYRGRFPIKQMQPVDAYAGSDDASMAADNTSAFNCRRAVSTGPVRWSAHAYGKAIDVNPVENPYLLGGSVLPPAGAAFLDRSRYRPGMALRDGPLVAAFTQAGWTWGGRWSSTPDYQHFSRTGS